MRGSGATGPDREEANKNKNTHSTKKEDEGKWNKKEQQTAKVRSPNVSQYIHSSNLASCNSCYFNSKRIYEPTQPTSCSFLLFCFLSRSSNGMRPTHEILEFHPPFFNFSSFTVVCLTLCFQPCRFVPKCPDAPIFLSLLFPLVTRQPSKWPNSFFTFWVGLEKSIGSNVIVVAI